MRNGDQSRRDTDRHVNGRNAGGSDSQGEPNRDRNGRGSDEPSPGTYQWVGYGKAGVSGYDKVDEPGESGPGNRYDNDYLHWRDEQIKKLDQDYSIWQSERRRKFAEDFDKWRNGWAEKSNSQPGGGDKK